MTPYARRGLAVAASCIRPRTASAGCHAAPPPAATAAQEPEAGADDEKPDEPPAGPAGKKPDEPTKPAERVKAGPDDFCVVDTNEDGSRQGLTASSCDILGTSKGDWLKGEGKDEVICGLGGDDWIDGGDGDDVLVGGEGDDALDGQGGTDCMVGGPGQDSAPVRDIGADGLVDTESPGPERGVGVSADRDCYEAAVLGVTYEQEDPPQGASSGSAYIGSGVLSATATATVPVTVFVQARRLVRGAGGRDVSLPVVTADARGAIILPLRCEVGQEDASVVITRRGRRLTKVLKFRCGAAGISAANLKLTKRGRRAIRRGAVRAVLRITVDGRMSEREILLERGG